MTNKERLIELLNEVAGNVVNIPTDGFIAYLADHLLANGVAFATDTNDGCKWINVEDRLPEKNVDVLIYNIEGHMGSDFIENNGKWFWNDELLPTHWMPLPVPPKEEI